MSRLFPLRRTLWSNLGSYSWIWTHHTISFGHTRPKWRSMTVMQRTMAPGQTLHINFQARWGKANDLSSFCSHRTWIPSQIWGHLSSKMIQIDQKIYGRITALQQPSQSPDLSRVQALKELYIKKMFSASPHQREKLIKSYRKSLCLFISLLLLKGVLQGTESWGVISCSHGCIQSCIKFHFHRAVFCPPGCSFGWVGGRRRKESRHFLGWFITMLDYCFIKSKSFLSPFYSPII